MYQLITNNNNVKIAQHMDCQLRWGPDHLEYCGLCPHIIQTKCTINEQNNLIISFGKHFLYEYSENIKNYSQYTT